MHVSNRTAAEDVMMLLPSRRAAVKERIGVTPGVPQNFFDGSQSPHFTFTCRLVDFSTSCRFLFAFEIISVAMAKSARASVIKSNHRKLRATVFGPAHDARTARLSAKLQELVAKPKPEAEKPMDVDDKNVDGVEDQASNDNTEGIFKFFTYSLPRQKLIQCCRNGR